MNLLFPFSLNPFGTIFSAVSKLRGKKQQGAITNQTSENTPFQDAKCPWIGSCDINYTQDTAEDLSNLPENLTDLTINKTPSITDNSSKASSFLGKTQLETGEGDFTSKEEKSTNVAPALFGGGTTTETGEGSLKTGLSTGTIVGIAGAGVLLIVLLVLLGGKK